MHAGRRMARCSAARFFSDGFSGNFANVVLGITRWASKIDAMSTSSELRTLMREAESVKASGTEPTPAQKKLLRTKRRDVQRAR